MVNEKTIEIICTTCKKPFHKILKEYNRQIKKGNSRFFCNLKCTAITRNKENPQPGNIKNLVADNRRDDYTQFRWFVNRGKYRSKTKGRYGCDITVEYLKDLWDKQNGVCPITGWNLILPKDSSYPWEEKNPANASLDRIDNSIGYVQGNVRFIAVIANLARQDYSDGQVVKFCLAVINNLKPL